MTFEELLISKGVIDKDWNFLESGGEEKDCHHLYCIKGTKHYSIVVICLILMAMGRGRKTSKLNDYEFAINKGWFTIRRISTNDNLSTDTYCMDIEGKDNLADDLLPASYAMEDAFAMLKYIDGITLIKMAGEMMRERIWI